MKGFTSGLLLLATVCVAMAQGDIIDELGEMGNTELLRYIERAGLTDVLRSEGPFTLFAPSQAALEALPDIVKRLLEGAPEFLAQVLVFHVTPGRVYARELENEMLLDTVEGSQNRINIYGDLVTATGAPISMVDLEASNGVIHVLDRMVLPLPRVTLLEEVASDPDFSVLASLVLMADLGPTLGAPGALTLFAPSNRAFAQVPDDILQDLIANPDKLRQVLLYHVVGGTQFSAGLVSGEYTTVQGQPIEITVNNGGVQVNSAEVETADIGARNGVLHAINGVLLPQL